MADLWDSIQAIDGNPISGMLGVNYEINLAANLDLSAAIPFLSVQAGDTLTFEGNGRTIDGGRSGVATFADVTAQRMTGSGGKGGAGLNYANGGSGAGAGGGGLGASGVFSSEEAARQRSTTSPETTRSAAAAAPALAHLPITPNLAPAVL